MKKTIMFGDDKAIHGSPNIVAPKRSSRKIKPVKFSDYTTNYSKINTKSKEIIANGYRCTAWDCPNKYPISNTSFFSYPSDIASRKVWIKNCGSENLLGPNKKVKNSLKVCGMHFSDEMYKNKNKRNRLVPKAVPTIFNNCDTSGLCNEDVVGESTDVNNVAKTILHNYSTNNDTRINYQLPINLMNKEMVEPQFKFAEVPSTEVNVCDVPGCIYSLKCFKERKVNSKFRPFVLFNPSTKNVNEWSSILGIPLTAVESNVCERHFKPAEMISQDIFIEGSGLSKLKGLLSGVMPVKKLGAIKRPRVNYVGEDFIKITKKLSKDSPKTKSKPKLVSPTADQQDVLNHILPKILRNNSLTISMEPATVNQSKRKLVSAPESSKTSEILNNLRSNFGQILPKKIINNAEEVKEIANTTLEKSESMDNPLIITIEIDDSSEDEQIPLMEDLKAKANNIKEFEKKLAEQNIKVENARIKCPNVQNSTPNSLHEVIVLE